MIQLCDGHINKEKQFREQGRRAGKDEYLSKTETEEPAVYIDLLEKFVDVYPSGNVVVFGDIVTLQYVVMSFSD